MKRISACLIVIFLLFPVAAGAAQSLSQNEKTTILFFDAIRHSPPMLRGFLAAMPKGADLHMHASGAVYAEDYLDWAMQDNRCVNPQTFVVRAANSGAGKKGCPDETVPALPFLQNAAHYAEGVNALSNRDADYASSMWGHDHFFDAFAKFGAARDGRKADMLASIVRRAAAQHIMHLEIMDSIYPDTLNTIAAKAGWNGNADDTLQALRDNGLFASIENSVTARRNVLAAMRAQLGDEAQDVSVLFIQQISRTSSPEQVFAQLAYSFELVRQDPAVVALNLVAPEDNPVALRDYSLHMAMIDSLYSRPEYTGTRIALHAGELALGLVPPRHMRFHIRQAVEQGHALRIGHGVDIMYEDNPFDLLRTMKNKRIAVEICLSSNDQILNVRGSDHPFPVYRNHTVPVVLSTDDEGISRSDLTNEYLRATATYGLGYGEIKALSRNSLEYSFLDGESLWADPTSFTMHNVCKDSLIGHETATCTKLLNESAKARMQWALEANIAQFERTVAERLAQ